MLGWLGDAGLTLHRLHAFAWLFCMAGTGALLGNIAECRRWHMLLAHCMCWFAQAFRLPHIVGIAMPAALLSNAAANGMLASSYNAGGIDRRALLAGGMANSFLAHTAHSIRILYPVIAVLGLPGVLYFLGQIAGEFLFVLAMLFWNRRHSALTRPHAASENPLPLPWLETLRLALRRSAIILLHIACITVPLALGIEWLLQHGFFDFWEKVTPAWLAQLYPAEMLSVIAAQFGGIMQSASLASALRDAGIIDDAHILLAMLTASAISNPFRMLRRNLPSALGLFPPSVACTLVFGMQFARFCIAVLLIGLVICWIL